MDVRALRAYAEDNVRVTRRDVAALTGQDVQALVHELQVHQIELEMQNESLRCAQQDLEASQAQYKKLFDRAPVCYVILNAAGVIVGANTAALHLFDRSRESLLRRKLTSLFLTQDVAALQRQLQAAAHASPTSCELQLRTQDDSSLHIRVDISYSPSSDAEYLVVVSDITERIRQHSSMERLNEQLASYSAAMAAHNARLESEIARRAESELQRDHMESRLRASERMESLGLLAAGIAHDFNNLLVSVVGNAEILLLAPGLSDDLRAPAVLIKRAGRHASELTRQLLEFAGKGQLQVSLVELAELVSDNLELLQPRLPKGVQLLCEPEQNLPSLMADRGQINQVVMNLVTNAIEAIDGAGVITVRTRTQSLDRELLAQFQHNYGVSPGSFLVLEVRDNGQGIDATTLTRIFDPFFSTKLSGRGLGLASVMGIVQSHGGALRVRAAAGVGTCFEVALPVSHNVVGPKTQPVSQAPDWTSTGTGTVLLIEDDDAVREVIDRLLTHLGFRVVAANGGASGLDMFRGSPEVFTLVVLDWIMPGFSGAQVLKALREQDVNLPVILLSGYGPENLVIEDEHVVRAQKPMTLAQLQQAVRTAIGAPAGEVH